jgi:hypothetical protein
MTKGELKEQLAELDYLPDTAKVTIDTSDSSRGQGISEVHTIRYLEEEDFEGELYVNIVMGPPDSY